MEFFVAFAVAGFAFYSLARSEAQRRIGLLATHLGKFQIEKLLRALTEGYARALDAGDPQRRAQIWPQTHAQEDQLSAQFAAFASAVGTLPEAQTRTSTLPFYLPYADRWLPGRSFDFRKIVRVHADGIARAVANSAGMDAKSRAFALSAEMLLMQHSCHWFCKSKAIASARMLVRHKTPYAQLLASVSAETREAYRKVVKA
jgi:hypothetical protein